MYDGKHSDLLADITEIVLVVLRSLVEGMSWLTHQIGSQYGPEGVIAFYIMTAVVGFLLVTKLIGLLFSFLKYLALPALILAWIIAWLTPYSFGTMLPATTAGCALVLLFKG